MIFIQILDDYLKEIEDGLQELEFKDGHFTRILNWFDGVGTVFIIGNGGSAANAIHIANDLQKIGGIPAFALTNISLVTAWANDKNYKYCFSEQLSRVAKPGDVLILLSTSGESKNIIEANKWAKEHGLYQLVITANFDSKLCETSPTVETICIHLPTGPAEDFQLVIGHILSYLVRDRNG